MPKDETVSTILVIGSGPIVIGQAAEFDYAGTQACIALREEGYRVVLVNNNPATIMTDEQYADVVYFEPLTIDKIEEIIQVEKPDGLLATLGGQTGLNLAYELHDAGVLAKYEVRLLGTPIDSIKKGEDREAFRQLMYELEEPVPESDIITSWQEAIMFAQHVGFPIIVRPAYTLGGTGGGIASTLEELAQIVQNGLRESPIKQCLVERSVAGYKEIEYEVMRDKDNTCITICNMENIDPVGIHTGDSIVVAPSQTLTDQEYQMLRNASIKIISALGIIGGCNIQFALDPNSKQYYLIEVNPRVSRSSALASKATGYPIARMAAKLAVGYSLAELTNPVTGDTYASFEPALDYVVVKFPRWPFDKFPDVQRTLGTQMKATGEVMAIARTFEAALQKAVRSLELGFINIEMATFTQLSVNELINIVKQQDDRRLFALTALLRHGKNITDLHDLTKIDHFFLHKLQTLIFFEKEMITSGPTNIPLLKMLKEYGFSDAYIASVWGISEKELRDIRKQARIIAAYKMVDTCAAEFEAVTSYYYSDYHGENEVAHTGTKKKVLIIGSGPIRIGQGIEFDYSAVHSVIAAREEGYETILLNNNPETVSTDYETADKLYFEPLTFEDVMNVIEAENITNVLVQFGGQTAINLVKRFEEAGVSLAGTTSDVIDVLEDRERFYHLLDDLNIPHIPGTIATTETDVLSKATQLGYPLLIRPSYVIGGQGMTVITCEEDMLMLTSQYPQETYPLLLDAYVPAKEVEVDLVANGEEIVSLPMIAEHVERAGIHSGDSTAIFPAQSINEDEERKIMTYARAICQKLAFKGIMNIQYVIDQGTVYVLEVNPRASRTVPIVSKLSGVPLAQIATKILLGKYISTKMDWQRNYPFVAIKYPVFSTQKIVGLDPLTGPDMKSTGEGLAIASNINEAMRKSFYTYMKSEGDSVWIDCWEDLSFTDQEKIKEAIVNANLYLQLQYESETKPIVLLSMKKDGLSIQNRITALKNRIFQCHDLAMLLAFLEAYQTKTTTVLSLQAAIKTIEVKQL
ncbi:carbamoyl phosphate synthase large subunit [Bacillus sp. HMF5848]|uniref:carbamoyl phosphate synthase large subunit n=1 Tax=Bacillus sp. HMF5848 TaxID=2495421 RepID=UPI000F7901E2|nr:carbamoyl phosphate synthase large subunit [Bacillus sp. HMF5848]RSK26453.1 carbamoyl phosphate synthase large subunit [Bacillus sp. HMF5848]